MHLSTMVNLVLKQVHQQAIASFNLDTSTSIDPQLAASLSKAGVSALQTPTKRLSIDA
jgi:hypothetical protein